MYLKHINKPVPGGTLIPQFPYKKGGTIIYIIVYIYIYWRNCEHCMAAATATVCHSQYIYDIILYYSILHTYNTWIRTPVEHLKDRCKIVLMVEPLKIF